MGRWGGKIPGPRPTTQRPEPGPLPSWPHCPPVEWWDFWAGVGGAVGGKWGRLGGIRGRGTPGDLAERRGQAGQVEGTGAAITAEQLPAVPAGGTLVLILLTRDMCVWKTQDGAALPETPTPTIAAQGHPSSLAHSQLKSCPDCLLPGAPHNPTISETLAPPALGKKEQSLRKSGFPRVPALQGPEAAGPSPCRPFLTGQWRAGPAVFPLALGTRCPLCLRLPVTLGWMHPPCLLGCHLLRKSPSPALGRQG